MTGNKHTLRHYIYRVLAFRVGLATVCIAAILVAIVIFSQRNQVSELVIETTQNRIRLLREQTKNLIDQSAMEPLAAFQKALATLQTAKLELSYGHFRYVRFYDSTGTLLTESAPPGQPDRDALLAPLGEAPQRFPQTTPWHQVIRINGRPHIHLVVPIAGREEATVAYAEGIFAISDKALDKQQSALLRTLMWVILIVLTTAAILYPTILALTRRLARFSEELLLSHLETVQILGSAIAKRDSDTSAHNFRVTILSVRVAEGLKLSNREIQKLIIGAFLHDVGKIAIRDEILLKPARLNADEFEVMKTHVGHGMDIICRTEWLKGEQPQHVDAGLELLAGSSWLTSANKVVASHHEKFDGSGYPMGLSGEEIPLAARIFSVVDVFDALTCSRPYKKPFSFEKSLAILAEGRGTHFDPRILDIFTPLAAELFEQIAGREDEQLKAELEEITGKYFHAGLETLEY